MKKHNRQKLALHRETLVSLQRTDVDQVNGGATTTLATSSQACISAISAISAATVHTRGWGCERNGG